MAKYFGETAIPDPILLNSLKISEIRKIGTFATSQYHIESEQTYFETYKN